MNKVIRTDHWGIVQDYLEMDLSIKEIASKHKRSPKQIENVIAEKWKKFQNARESRMLIASQGSANLFDKMSKEYLETNRITEDFKDLLSGDSDPLSDNELLFCNLLVETGDLEGAIEQSHLDVGLKGTKKDKQSTSFRNSLRLRALYLKKKPNVASYIYDLEKLNSKVLEDSKVFLMESVIEQIRYQKARNNPRESTSISKNLELLAKLTDNLNSRTQLEIVSGDDSLNEIMRKAQEAKEVITIE